MTTAPHTARGDEQIIAAVTAGHIRAGMPPTEGGIAALRRVSRGETTTEQELDRVEAEICAVRA